MQSRIEKDIESRACKEVKKRWQYTIIRKMNGQGYRSWPDRMFLMPGIPAFFIEFKRPESKGPTKLQVDMIEQLRSIGHAVYVCSSVNDALEAVRTEILSEDHR